MDRFSTTDLGNYRGDNYFLVGYVEPGADDGDDYDPAEDADNYGYSLVQKAESPVDENVEIVRMDTCHDQPHLDKEFLPPDVEAEKKVWLDDGYTFRRMKGYLLENWQKFVDAHIYYNE